jgi:hypothetical protein
MPGARREFDRSLEAIEAKVIELFAMIVEGLPLAARALLGADSEGAWDPSRWPLTQPVPVPAGRHRRRRSLHPG